MNRKDGSSTFAAVPSVLQAGALSGSCGLLYGGVSGVLKAYHPVIKSISTGVYWFAFGSSFWWLRSNILRVQFEDNATPKERIYASVASSSLSGGAVNWAISKYSMHTLCYESLPNDRRFIPGFIACSILGLVGQYSYNKLEERQIRLQSEPVSSKTWAERMADSRWIPIKNLSDEQYRNMLEEKLLSVDVEIALIDDNLKALRESSGGKEDSSE
ncbi:hypothetical protein FQN49_000299 [Arthroderma sp. PD_2]|nr:hypothetical protein FQN49_000299 [Arthroderma sp. PD_2]